MSSDVLFADWQAAPFALNGETVFAVGDVHGCGDQLARLLAVIGDTARMVGGPTRLVFLGDLIDRGPGNLETLKLWAAPASAWGVDRVDRLMGNHEQLLLLAMGDGPHAAKAAAMWLSERMGGSAVLAELCRAAARTETLPSAGLFRAALGDEVFDRFCAMGSHASVGNALFVHGGLDPRVSAADCLAQPWQSFTAARWAWVHGEFLQWTEGFGGTIVVHGHTPPHMHRELTGQDDPHQFAFDRLGLDGGTTRTGIVTGAQIETGRYRILRAVNPASPS
jgi:serine/threonine protein phosphatase 1